jgi:hypothetical protein
MLPSLALSRLLADEKLMEAKVLPEELPLWRTPRVTWEFVSYAKVTVVRRLKPSEPLRHCETDAAPHFKRRNYQEPMPFPYSGPSPPTELGNEPV